MTLTQRLVPVLVLIQIHREQTVAQARFHFQRLRYLDAQLQAHLQKCFALLVRAQHDGHHHLHSCT